MMSTGITDMFFVQVNVSGYPQLSAEFIEDLGPCDSLRI
jgi:hypothetical protein